MRHNIGLEIISTCNFNCNFCTYQFVKRRLKLGVEDIEKIFKGMPKSYIACVMLTMMGEPLLHPQLKEICEEIKKYKMFLGIVTNGSLLSPIHHELPLNHMVISVRSTSPETFIHRRSDLNYEKYLDNIVNFVKDRRYTIKVALMVGSERFPKSFMGLADCSSQEEMRKVINNFGQRIDPSFCFSGEVNFDQHLRYNINASKNLIISIQKISSWSNLILPDGYSVEERSNFNCDVYRRTFAVLANGDVTGCCLDYNGEMKIGNINDQPLGHIIRESYKSKPNLGQYELCRKCRGKVIRGDGTC